LQLFIIMEFINKTKNPKFSSQKRARISKKRLKAITNNSDDERESHEEDESQSTTSTSMSGGRSLRSFVWDFFQKDDNEITATCKVVLDNGEECGVSYNDGSTTSNLINHLARKHRIFRNNSSGQPNVIAKNQIVRTENEYELIRQDLVSFIIEDSQPFHIVLSKRFQKLLHSLDENFPIPCDKVIKTMIGQAFSWSKQQLMTLLNDDCIAISMTMDFWTSRRQQDISGLHVLGFLILGNLKKLFLFCNVFYTHIQERLLLNC
jgi:hypothetical protein